MISTSCPAEVGKILSLRLALPDREICVQAVVRRVLPGAGMGIEFESMSADDRDHLDRFVQRMELELPPETRRPPGPDATGVAASRLAADGSGGHDSPPASAAAAPRNNRVERRSRIRHKFAATVELSRLGSAEPVMAELSDLAQGGCHVLLADPFPVGAALEISVTANGQSFRASANVVSAQPGQGMGLAFTGIAPKDNFVLDSWLVTSLEREWLASNRRKSQRVLVNIPVQVAAKNTLGTDISEDTQTISINAHGALLQLEMDVAKGQTVLLRNISTQNVLECSVDYLGANHNGRREVGVSFVLPGRTLWQIAFPPSDWSPQHPCAKRT